MFVQQKARMVLGKIGLPLMSFSMAFAGPSFVQSWTSNTVEFRSIAQPLVIRLDQLSLPASALEDVRLIDSEPKSPPHSLVTDELRSGERDFRPDSTKVAPNSNYYDWFAAPLITVSEYLQEAQAYQPVALFNEEQIKRANPTGYVDKYVENNSVFSDVAQNSDNVAGDSGDGFLGGASAYINGGLFELPNSNTPTTKPRSVNIASIGSPKAFTQPMADLGRMLEKGLNALDIAPTQDQIDTHLIHGRVELTRGLAFLPGSQNLKIVRYLNGAPTGEVAQIHYSEGTYRIKMRGTGGTLIATLVDDIGEVIGHGSRDISGEKNQVILINPVTAGLDGRVISAYSFGSNARVVAEARVEVVGTSIETRSVQDGRFIVEDVAAGSQFHLRVSKEGYWPTLLTARAGEELEIPLFPNNMINALAGLTVGRGALKDGVIWGQITYDGAPLEGAQIELADNSQKAVYFESLGTAFLPQASHRATQSNGYFAFMNVSEGPQTLRVIVPGRLDHFVQVVTTQRGHLTYTRLSLEKKNARFVSVSDALRFNQMIPATLRWMGSEITYEYSPQQNEVEITHMNGLGLHAIEVDAGPRYALSRQNATFMQSKMHVSPVSEAFLNQAQDYLKIGLRPGSSRVVGLIQGKLGAVDIEDPYWNGEIVYFNEDGRFVQTPWEAENGGFVLFNVPEGLQTVQIAPPRSTKRATKLILTDPGYVNVLYHQFPH